MFRENLSIELLWCKIKPWIIDGSFFGIISAELLTMEVIVQILLLSFPLPFACDIHILLTENIGQLTR